MNVGTSWMELPECDLWIELTYNCPSALIYLQREAQYGGSFGTKEADSLFLVFVMKSEDKDPRYPRQRSTVRSVITRCDKVLAYRAKIQSRFSRKQSLKRKIFILYFRLLFSRRITPFPLVPSVTNHPVHTYQKFAASFAFSTIETFSYRNFQPKLKGS